MNEQPIPVEFDQALRELGLAGSRPLTGWPLTGGVSSDIWCIQTDQGQVCAKRALAKLRVAADWRAPIERNLYEARWMQQAQIAAPGSVPRVLGQHMGLGVLVAVVLAAVLARFLPKGWFWDKMILQAAIDTNSQAPTTRATESGSLVGRRGVVASALMPSGQIEIDGRRYEARVAVGMIEAGATVVVVKRSDFGLVVERTDA